MDTKSNTNNSGSVFRLKVHNIPIDMEKDAVESLFSEHGEVTGIQLIKISKKSEYIAYITFSKYEEAERAITALNNKLPLQLTVEFEDKTLRNFQKTQCFDLSNPIRDFRYKESCLDDHKPEKKVIDTRIVKCSPDFQPNTFSHNDELLYEVPVDLTTFNPYECTGPYRNTNLMYTRGTIHMDFKDKTRHVAYGRGYTYYSLPEPNPYVGSYIQNIIEKRQKGLYEFAPENEEDNTSLCKICSTPTRFRCQKCEIAYYCTRNCQVEDWPKHKSECQSIPPLVRKVITKSAEQNDNTSSNMSHENVVSSKKEKLVSTPAKHVIHDVQPKIQNTDIPSKCNGVKEAKINDKIEKNVLKTSPENALSQELQKKLVISKILSLPSALEKLKVGSKGMAILHALIGQEKFNITLIPENEFDGFSQLLESLKTDCLNELKKEPNYRPKIGDFVCGEGIQDDWFRGIVVSLTPVIKLAAVDEARIFVPTKVVPIPEKYCSTSKFGFTFEFSKGVTMPKIETGTPFEPQFEVVEILKKNESVLIKITADELMFTGQGVVTEWKMKSEQMGIKYAPLISGQEVIITDFSSQNLIYVQSQATEEMERVHLLHQKIAKYALNRKPLDEAPVIGQIVLAHFTLDDNFYRAVVNKIVNNDVIIIYIDYGNEEKTTLDKLFELPEELKEPASCVSKVTLKGVPTDVPMNKETSLYFTELTGNKWVLKCTFTGHPLEEGVILTTSSKDNVNQDVTNLLKPSWEKPSEDEELKVYCILDLPTFEFGKAGDEIQAILLYYFPNNGAMYFAHDDYQAAEAIQVHMSENIAKYVQSNTQMYIPRNGELCIAKYKDSFYRATCLEHSCTPDESRVFFIDYGNTERVKHTDIRLFSEEFKNLRPFGKLCNIRAMVPDDKFTPEVSKRIEELAPVDEIYKIKIAKVDKEDDEPSIIIPDIHSQLIKEKLL